MYTYPNTQPVGLDRSLSGLEAGAGRKREYIFPMHTTKKIQCVDLSILSGVLVGQIGEKVLTFPSLAPVFFAWGRGGWKVGSTLSFPLCRFEEAEIGRAHV